MQRILDIFVAALPSTLEQGLIYAVLALGILITYTILNFPDLTVDGSFRRAVPSPPPLSSMAGSAPALWQRW